MVTYLSWRWIFWINVPIGAFGVTLAFRVLRDSGRRPQHHLALVGMGSRGLGLFGILWAITRRAPGGWPRSMLPCYWYRGTWWAVPSGRLPGG